jgi:Putative adhesin
VTRAAAVAASLAAACLASAPRWASAQPASSGETVIPEVVERSTLEVSPSSRAFTTLSIENSLGDVRIEGHDSKLIVIETHKRAPDEPSIDRLRVSLIPGLDGSVRIGTAVDVGGPDARPVTKNATRIDLVVQVPRDLKFSASVGSGHLEVSGMDAGGEVDATSGPITMRNIAGAIMARSISGTVTLSEMFGSIDAETIDAAVMLDSIASESLVASAHRGAINGRRVRAKHIDLTTTTGDVDLEGEVALGGKLIVSSLRGNITVHLRGRGVMSVRAVGTKVDLGGAKARVIKGVTLAEVGRGDGSSGIDLRTGAGVVAFAVSF